MKNIINQIIGLALWSLIFCVAWHSFMFVWSEIKGDEVQALKSAIKALWAVGLLLLFDILDIDPL